MRKGGKIAAVMLAMVAAGTMAAGLAACDEEEDAGRQEQTNVAEKIKDGGTIVFTNGSSSIDLTQYVKANGNAYRVAVSNPKVAGATVSGNTLTVTKGEETGSAIVTVACGDVRLTFTVVVANMFYTVTLDGSAVPPEAGEKWAEGSTYVLPEAKESDDPNMEFKGWNVNGETKQAGESVTVDKNLVINAVFERRAAEEVKGHAQSISVSEGKAVTVAIADYIAAYGREVTASSPDTDKITVSAQDGTVELTGVSQGVATLTLSTEGVTVTVTVNVLSADMPTFANATLEVDLFTQKSNRIAFTPQEPSEEHEYAYVYSLQTQDARASLADGVLTFTPAEDHDIEEDGSAVPLVVEAAVSIDGEAAGTVTFTVTVRIVDTAPEAPKFKDVTQAFDPFGSGYTLTLKADDENFTYTYEIDGVQVTGSKVYTAETEETVYVTYTYKGNTERSGTASFTVRVSYDRSVFPELKEESKTESVDLAEVEGGVYTLDLFANFTNAENIEGYTVNGTAHTDGAVYTISNSGNVYGEAATEETFTVVATFKKGLGSLTYTYTVNVTDTTAFRMENGGFEKKDANGKPTGWTGAKGSLSSAGTYFPEQWPTNNDGQYYVGIDGGTETLVSPSFKVGGSGWITFKFGSARPTQGSSLRNIHLEFYEKGDGGDKLIADVRNILWKDPEAALKLNDYKLDLSAFKGKTVYVKAVDGEDGGDFRSIYLDAFVTYWKTAPTNSKYTDLTATRFIDLTAQIDLKDTNTVTLNPYLSQGLVSDTAFTAAVDKEGLTVSSENPLEVTAAKSGSYKITYTLGGETVFTANVIVTNTAETPAFEDKTLRVKKGESGTLALPEPEEGSRFAYAYTVTADGAGVSGNVLSFNTAGMEEGTYPVQISVTVTDRKWGENGDTFEKTFTVTVTVYGEKIIAGDLLSEGKAELSLDAYAIGQETIGATSAQIDFSKYLIIPESVNAVYTVTRKIGDGEVASVTAENGVYALPFADCDLTPNVVKTVVFEVTAENGEDASNTVSFTLTVLIKDTTGNRVVNGGFETGNLQGWTVLSGAIDLNGGTSSAEHNDWVEHLPYNKTGNYFCANAGLAEHAAWELKSSSFVLGGNGYISFKMASNNAILKVYKADGTQIYSYTCHTFSDTNFPHVENGGNWCTLRTHYADLHEFIGEELYITIGNSGAGGVWEFGYFDDIVTYYEEGAVMTGRQDDVLLTCQKDGVSHTPGETVKMNWIVAPNEYVAPTKE